MNTKKKLALTKLLFFLSIVLSLGSFVTIGKGYGEIYPFYYWKLFSQPYGWDGAVDDYRVYAKKDSKDTWVRLENHGYKDIDQDDYFYLILNQVNLYEEDSTLARKKLLTFCQYIAPEYDKYKIVKETFNPYHVNLKADSCSKEDIIFIP